MVLAVVSEAIGTLVWESFGIADIIRSATLLVAIAILTFEGPNVI